MADEQDRAEALDDDELDGEYPPDKLLGAEAYGAAGTEPGAPESVAQRAAREEPEEVPLDRPLTSGDPEAVVLADGDDFTGDETLRDVVQEREAPIPAEEAAIHVVDEGAGGFDSEVDDPELAAAYEIDPEPDR
jgi:hypothetical protein